MASAADCAEVVEDAGADLEVLQGFVVREGVDAEADYDDGVCVVHGGSGGGGVGWSPVSGEVVYTFGREMPLNQDCEI